MRASKRTFTLLAVVVALLVSCSSSGTAPELVTYVFQHRTDPGAEGQFVVRTSDPRVIATARQQLKLPPEQRKLHINGLLAAGDGGYNAPWHWRIKDNNWDFAEVSIELCDGRPRYVEDDLDYWVNNVKSFCPWSSFVLQERR